MNKKQNRKLLFFDIDGTLLAGGLPGYIPDSAIEALTKAQANGHYLFINSGRTYSFMPALIREFPFDGYICGCGTEIILHGETIFHHDIPRQIRFNMVEKLRRAKIHGVFEGRHACYYDDTAEVIPTISEVLAVYAGELGSSGILTFSDPELNYDKFIIFYDQNSDLQLFRELTGGDFDFIGREAAGSYGFAELVPRGCSKASGIDFMVEYLGLSLDDCYVFGDSANDLSMLLHVKNSIAMGNAYPEVLGKTSYVTTPVDRDGIMNALKHFRLI